MRRPCERDNAEWIEALGDRRRLSVPDGVRLVYRPPDTPELQPAETLWPLVDEPVVNHHVTNLAELERVVEQRCMTLSEQTDLIRPRTSFHWLPKTDHIPGPYTQSIVRRRGYRFVTVNAAKPKTKRASRLLRDRDVLRRCAGR